MINIDAGEQFLRAADKSPVKIDAAFWHLDDADQWRFCIHTPLVDKYGEKYTYKKLQQIAAQHETRIKVSDITLIREDHHLLRILRMFLSTDGKFSNLRMQRNTFNGIYIEDVFVYRL